MPKFRKKPVVIEARQYTGLVRDHVDVVVWCGGQIGYETRGGPNGEAYQFCVIPTFEGDMKASPGDWVIKGVNGEFYPCKPDIFDKTYEPVEDGE